MKTISIIVPFLNRIEFLNDLLLSISKQTYTEIELIIVDDGSTQESFNSMQAKVEEFKNEIKIIKILRNLENKGVSHARNVGLGVATGDYILFLDSDDMLCGKYSLEERVEILENESMYGAIAGYSVKISKETKVVPTKAPETTEDYIRKSIKNYKDFALNFIEYYKEKQKLFFFVAGGTLFRKESIDGLLFNENLKQNEDIFFALDLIEKGVKLKMIRMPVYFKRSHGNHLSSGTPVENENMILAKMDKLKPYIINNY